MERIKLAVIGCGAVAEVFHLPTLQRLPEFEIEYLADVNRARIDYLKDKFATDCKSETDYKKALMDEEVDAVMILTPPKYHHQIAIDAAEAGKHVFCEKPFAMNYVEAEDMVDACEDNKVKLMAGFNFRFVPQYKKIKEMIEKGLFGTLVGGHSTMFSNAFAWPSVSKFQYKKAEGGGALFEMGVHYIDLMNWFFGKAKSVNAKISTLTNDVIDDTACVFIQYDCGASCAVYTGWNHLSINTLTVIGLDGYATTSPSKNEIFYTRKNLVSQAPISINVKKGLTPYHEELKYFYDCITKKKDTMSGMDIINSVKVVEKAYESNRDGTTVFL